MFDKRSTSKIKNDKILCWRIKLGSFSFNIQYRPGKENILADTLSRVQCSAMTTDNLVMLHTSLCHPGVTRFSHFVRSRNLPYSTDEVKEIVSSCSTCAELKSNFFKPGKSHPLERLNLDFKGPLPSKSRNTYLLTIIDEYSRFQILIHLLSSLV